MPHPLPLPTIPNHEHTRGVRRYLEYAEIKKTSEEQRDFSCVHLSCLSLTGVVMTFSLVTLGQERFPLVLTVGELKKNDKESLNRVDYCETYWLAFNYSCALSKTVEPIGT